MSDTKIFVPINHSSLSPCIKEVIIDRMDPKKGDKKKLPARHL